MRAHERKVFCLKSAKVYVRELIHNATYRNVKRGKQHQRMCPRIVMLRRRLQLKERSIIPPWAQVQYLKEITHRQPVSKVTQLRQVRPLPAKVIYAP